MANVSVTTEGATPSGDGVAPRDQSEPPQRAAAGGDDLAGDIGRRLAAYRAQCGMRVADLAREVGVTPSLISQIERGLSRPSVSTLFAIAQALDVPVDAFFREPPSSGDPDGPGTPAGDVANVGHGEGPSPAGSRPGAGPFVPEVPVTSPAAHDEAATSDAGAAMVAPDPADRSQTRPTGTGRYKVHRGGRAVIDIQGGVRWERLTRTTYDHL